MKRVLLVSTGNIARGGVQKFLEEWIVSSKNQYEFTWYCCGKNFDNTLKTSFENLGVKVINGDINLQKISRYYFFAKDLRQELSQNIYDIIHINTGVISFAFVALKAVKKYNIPKIIVHSHNSSERVLNIYENILYTYLQNSIVQDATKLAACSQKAAEWMFGNCGEREVSWKYIRNKINVIQYKFDQKVREKYRQKIKVDNNNLVLGTVGRLIPVKNQMFLLKIMRELKQRNMNTILIIIGTGTLEEKLREQIKYYQLEDQVMLLGERKDVNRWLQAMDVFLMPSLHEGFPIAAIEAQATGLPCLFADNFSREIKLVDHVSFLPLDNLNLWITSVENIYRRRKDYSYRDEAAAMIVQKGFDISSFFGEIQDLYK